MIQVLLQAILKVISAFGTMTTMLSGKIDSLLTQQLSQSGKLDQINGKLDKSIAADADNAAKSAAAEATEAEEIKGQFASFEAVLAEILAAVVPTPTATIDVFVTMDGQTTQMIEGEVMIAKDTEQFVITLANPKDKKGSPSQIDPSKSTFTVDNPALATLVPDSTLDANGAVIPGTPGLQCVVKCGTAGEGQILGTVTDLNNPNDVIKVPLQLQVTAGDTASIEVATSEPVPQPA